jgi:hypothetical protein
VESNFTASFFLIGAGEGTTTGGSGVRNGDAMTCFRGGGFCWGDGARGAGVDEVDAELGVVWSFANRLRRICWTSRDEGGCTKMNEND